MHRYIKQIHVIDSMSIESANRADVRAAFDNISTVIYDTCKMGKDCKGVCYRFKVGKPYGKPYNTAAYCSRCEVWILFKDLKENGRCKCCNMRPRRKAFKQ